MNADEVVEKLPKYMFYVDEDGKASMMLDPIGAYVHVADLKHYLSGVLVPQEKFVCEYCHPDGLYNCPSHSNPKPLEEKEGV